MLTKFNKLTMELEASVIQYKEKKKYKVYQNIRKLLQAIKIEAQELRKTILNDFKNK